MPAVGVEEAQAVLGGIGGAEDAVPLVAETFDGEIDGLGGAGEDQHLILQAAKGPALVEKGAHAVLQGGVPLGNAVLEGGNRLVRQDPGRNGEDLLHGEEAGRRGAGAQVQQPFSAGLGRQAAIQDRIHPAGKGIVHGNAS